MVSELEAKEVWKMKREKNLQLNIQSHFESIFEEREKVIKQYTYGIKISDECLDHANEAIKKKNWHHFDNIPAGHDCYYTNPIHDYKLRGAK